MQGLNKKQRSLEDVWENCVRELYLAHAPYRLVYSPIVFPTDGSTASSLRLHLVLRTSFASQAPNPMMPDSRLRREAKLVTVLYVRLRNWRTMPWYGLQQAGTLQEANRLMVKLRTIENLLYNFSHWRNRWTMTNIRFFLIMRKGQLSIFAYSHSLNVLELRFLRI